MGIRAPLADDVSYSGMEIQILDDNAPKHANIKPWQFTSEVQPCPARNGTPKIGEWNEYETTATCLHINLVHGGYCRCHLNSIEDLEAYKNILACSGYRGDVLFLAITITSNFATFASRNCQRNNRTTLHRRDLRLCLMAGI